MMPLRVSAVLLQAPWQMRNKPKPQTPPKKLEKPTKIKQTPPADSLHQVIKS